MSWLKKVDNIDSNKQNLKKKVKDNDKKIPNAIEFVATQELNRLTKISLMQEWKSHRNRKTLKQYKVVFLVIEM